MGDEEGLAWDFLEYSSDVSEDSSSDSSAPMTSTERQDTPLECDRCEKPFDTSGQLLKHQDKCGDELYIDSGRYHSHCKIPGTSLHFVRNTLSGADTRVHVNLKDTTCTSPRCQYVSGLAECRHVCSCQFASEEPRICSYDEAHGRRLIRSKEIDENTFKNIMDLAALCKQQEVPLCLELSENPTQQRNFSVALFASAGNIVPDKRGAVYFADGKGMCAHCKSSTCPHVLIARWMIEEFPFEIQMGSKITRPIPDLVIERYWREKGFQGGQTPAALPTDLFPSETFCPYGCGTDCLLIPDPGRPKWTQVLIHYFETCNVKLHRKKCPQCSRLVYYKDSDLCLFNHEDSVLISHYLLKMTVAFMKRGSSSGLTYEVIKDAIGPRLRVKEHVFNEAVIAYQKIISE